MLSRRLIALLIPAYLYLLGGVPRTAYAQLPMQLRWQGGVADTALQSYQSDCTWKTKCSPARITAHDGWSGSPFLYGMGWTPTAWVQQQRLFVGPDNIEYRLAWRLNHFEFQRPPEAPAHYPERFPAGTLTIDGNRNGDGPWAVAGCQPRATNAILGGDIRYETWPRAFGTVATSTYEPLTEGPYWFGGCYVGGQQPTECALWGYPTGFLTHPSLPQSWVYSYAPRDAAGVWLIGYPRTFRIGDVTEDGRIDAADLFEFVTCWFDDDRRADANRDGTLSQQDIFDFLAAFLSN